MVKKKKIAIMASGTGSNFLAIMQRIAQQKLQIEVVRLVVDHDDAPVINYAKQFNVPVLTVSYQAGKQLAEQQIIAQLQNDQVDGIILAGFMRILSADFINYYPNRIINLHPALLPSFPGRHGIDDAYNYGVKITGITIHFVDATVDGGQIIAQAPVEITETDTIESLATKIHSLEHSLYPTTIQKLVDKGVF
ncbi:phosphoribosylglycinamide formyltransferase [Fructilactobacillus vespulae]|uniref:phosphoribosylglycinamide formyltransferase n=1 Tax=Fructilactobacillus vespulae TaxID=1249630 RepID=UPI0039B68BC3